MQILAMTVCTMVCAVLGLTSPSNRGGLLTTLLLLFVFMGSFAGYTSARVYKLFGGKEWKKNTVLTASLYPGLMGSIFLFINSFVAYWGSSTAAPLTTLLSLILLWIGVSTPLVFVGSFFGFKRETIEVPVRTNQIARHIPDQTWYTHPLFSVALGGVLPFGAVCIEFYFVMSALWLHQVHTLVCDDVITTKDSNIIYLVVFFNLLVVFRLRISVHGSVDSRGDMRRDNHRYGVFPTV